MASVDPICEGYLVDPPGDNIAEVWVCVHAPFLKKDDGRPLQRQVETLLDGWIRKQVHLDCIGGTAAFTWTGVTWNDPSAQDLHLNWCVME